MKREISAQTPHSLTHLIYEAANSNVSDAVDLVAQVVALVIRHGAGDNIEQARRLAAHVSFAVAADIYLTDRAVK